MFIEPFAIFVPNAHTLYILRHCIDIVFISQMSLTIIIRNPTEKSI
jgi:hypothetical protein